MKKKGTILLVCLIVIFIVPIFLYAQNNETKKHSYTSRYMVRVFN